MTNLDSILKSRDYFANNGPSSQGSGFSSSHVWMWELDYKEIWALKNWCFWTVVLEKILESPLDCKEIHSVNPQGNQSWIFMGRNDVEAETPILWPPDRRTDSLEKTLMLGKMSGGEGDDRGWNGWMASLTRWTWVWVSSESWWWTGRPGMLQSMVHKESDAIEQLNWTDSQLILWWFKLNNDGTQPYIYRYPVSSKVLSHPGWHMTLSRGPCAMQ